MIGTARKSTEGAHASLNPPLSRVMIRGHLKTNALQKGNVGPDSEYETRPLSTLIDSSKRHQAINRHLQSEDSNFSIQRRRAGKKGVRILRGGVVVCLLARGRVEGRGESVAGLVVWDHIPLRKCPQRRLSPIRASQSTKARTAGRRKTWHCSDAFQRTHIMYTVEIQEGLSERVQYSPRVKLS